MTAQQRSADVVIVGAGISGSLLAALLADQDLAVTVLEQRYQRPRDGRFAGIVTDSDFDALGLGRPPVDDLQPLQRVTAFTFQNGVTPPGREISGAYAIRHDDLLTWLRSIARDGGIILEQAATVMEWRWQDGAVAGVVTEPDATQWDARVVVLADESDPRLAEEPGLRPDWPPTQLMHIAKQHFEQRIEQHIEQREDRRPTLDEARVGRFFSSRTTLEQTGFGMLIPWKTTSTLAVVMRLEDEMTSSRHISEFVDEVRLHPAIAPAIDSLDPGAFVTEVVPIGGVAHPPRLSGDGVLILSDAVGLTHPLNRDGLSANVDVVKVAAATILDAGRAGDFSSISLSRFDERVRALVIDPLRHRAETASLPVDSAWPVTTRFQPLADLGHAYRAVDSDDARRRAVGQRPVSLRKRLEGLGRRIRHGD
ncbi:MAG: hypothetical protein AVDCRST_MAG43-937 [uncultured Thermomicrobiales bacterium]|uniref:FAD-binding domain-containing protein n=1 Tax=uncultured Thermomicrobiales bacterium TaxID=1645740 RepID=A0A6J4UJC8_9BACT|nr:MAG: hypothetical protein AVDCRST_MAG43-937 [uncultured Thermomicrobiales bacterium]